MKALGENSISVVLRALLGVASVVLWVALVALVIVASLYAGAMTAIHLGVLDPALLRHPAVRIEVSGEEKDILDWPAMTAAFVGAFLSIPATIVIVRRLKGMFDTFVAHDPFRAENGDHLRAIAIALIVIQGAHLAVYYVRLALTLLVVRPAHGEFSFSMSDETLTLWFVIAMLFVLAEVFREGARLRDEQNLTV